SHCHRARSNPSHICNYVKRLRHCWDQTRPCDACEKAALHASLMPHVTPPPARLPRSRCFSAACTHTVNHV
ncbi:hypothetical protein QBC35DRAFT_396429, partial [Podospora australis]